jgi:Holliday junction resolvase RusA-like endonuclease
MLTLSELGEPHVSFAVVGMQPAPQGSKKFKGRRNRVTKDGRTASVPVLADMSKRLDPWRSLVGDAARAAGVGTLVATLDGPVIADFVFTMRRSRANRNAGDWCPIMPDLDKLARAVGDACKMCGAISDDRLIVGFRQLAKVFVGSSHADTLPGPGVVIRLWRAPSVGAAGPVGGCE